jgi:phospholipid transport system substrate-binding protein
VSPEQIEAHVRVPSHHLLLDLLGDSDRHLRQVEDHFPEVRFVALGDEIALKGEEIAVIYKLRRENGKWKVYDAVVENISLINNYRSQFDRVISSASYDELLKRLREKVDNTAS